MKILITIEDVQKRENIEITGEALSWSQTSTRWQVSEGVYTYLQVPCVVVRKDNEVIIVPLREMFRNISVKVLED